MTRQEKAIQIYECSSLEAHNPVLNFNHKSAVVWKDAGKEVLGCKTISEFMEMENMVFSQEIKKLESINRL